MQISDLRDIHKGKRCFIIGTGPSLNKTDFSLIKDEILFGVNSLYRGFKMFGIGCKYYAVSDTRVWNKHSDEILNLDAVVFISSEIANSIGVPQNVVVVQDIGSMWIERRFSKNIEFGAFNGDTIIIDICLQSCFHMGFSEVYLLGCDCEDTGHFDDKEVGKANLNKLFTSYAVCKLAFEQDGRKIINCTDGGILEIFERKSLREVMR